MRPVKRNRLWRALPGDTELKRNEVHIWRTSLNLPERCLSQLTRTLSEDEYHKARHFRFERDRRHFIIRRGVLRAILARYLGKRPSQIKFSYSPYGKPWLTEELDEDLQFSISHSHEIALYAFNLSREIGIDLEYLRLLPDAEQIAVRFFSDQDKSVWLGLPVDQKLEAFYAIWTHMEARCKALGGGLDKLSVQDRVSLQQGELGHSQWSSIGGPRGIIAWSLETFVPFPQYIATLAVEGKEYRLSHYEWTHLDTIINNQN
jgi:4'-phosphopantetheinyl transferase